MGGRAEAGGGAGRPLITAMLGEGRGSRGSWVSSSLQHPQDPAQSRMQPRCPINTQGMNEEVREWMTKIKAGGN